MDTKLILKNATQIVDIMNSATGANLEHTVKLTKDRANNIIDEVVGWSVVTAKIIEELRERTIYQIKFKEEIIYIPKRQDDAEDDTIKTENNIELCGRLVGNQNLSCNTFIVGKDHEPEFARIKIGDRFLLNSNKKEKEIY